MQRSGAANGAPELEALIGETAPLEVVFAYGPIALLDGMHFGLSRMVARLDPESAAVANLERSLGIPYVFEFRGRTGFFGKLTFDADMPPVDLPMDRARIEFSGALLAGTFAGNRLAAHGSVDRFRILFADGRVRGRARHRQSRQRDPLPLRAARQRGLLGPERHGHGCRARRRRPCSTRPASRVDSVVQLDETRNLLDVQATGDARLRVRRRRADRRRERRHRRPQARRRRARDVRDGAARASRARHRAAALRALRPALERAARRRRRAWRSTPFISRFDGEPFTARLEIVTNAGALPATGTVDFEDPQTLLTLFDSSADIELSKKLAQSLAALAMQMQLANDPTLPHEDSSAPRRGAVGPRPRRARRPRTPDRERATRYRAELRVADGAVTVNGARLPFSVP